MAKNTETQVIQNYAGSRGLSVTLRNGNIDSFSTWRIGDPASKTKRMFSEDMNRKSFTV